MALPYSLSATQPSSSFSHPIFHIQDIMDEIFQWLPPSSLARLTSVGKMWFRSAVPLLWSRVTFLNALSPFGATSFVNDQHLLISCPTPENWARFQLYSPYVRNVIVTRRDIYLVYAVFLSRPTAVDYPYIFPNLQSLTWAFESNIEHGGIAIMMFLIPPTVRHLSLVTNVLPLSTLADFCFAITVSGATLEDLDLDVFHIELSPEYLQTFMRLILFASKTLRRLRIPMTFATQSVLDSLHQCTSLSSFSITRFLDHSFPPDLPFIGTARGAIRECGFDYLEHLSFYGPQELLLNAVFRRCSLSHISHLTLKFPSSLHGHDPHIIMRAIAGSCPQLEWLEICLDLPPGVIEDRTTLSSVPYSSIRPLIGCSKLRTLCIGSFSVSMDSTQLIEFLSSGTTTWVAIALFTEQPLQLNDLLTFAKFCPKLLALSLHVDASTDPDSIPDVPLGVSFSAITQLHFQHGMTGGRHASKIARFLSKLYKSPPCFSGLESKQRVALSLRIAHFYLLDSLSTGTPVHPCTRDYIRDTVEFHELMEGAGECMGFHMDYEEAGVDLDDDDLDNGSLLIFQRLKMWLQRNPIRYAFT